MSFFNDFLKYFCIDDLDAKTTITTIVGYGIVVLGKIRIKNIIENEITLISNKEKIIISGEKLEIKSISKGELVIGGLINNISLEKL